MSRIADVSVYRLAMSGEGELDATWKDKPHRLVFDLCNEIERLQERAKQSFVDPQFAKAFVEWSGEETIKKQKVEIERLRVYPAAVDKVRSRYPTDVFPDSAGTGARFARSLCDRIHELAAKAAKEGES